MRSIIPAVEIKLDLGSGPKVHHLRRTNFSSVALMGIMGSPELAAANAALDEQRKTKAQDADDDEPLGREFLSLRLDHQCRLMAAQLFGLLQYDHPNIEYRDLLASIPPDPVVIGEIGRKCMEAWGRGEPPKAPETPVEESDENEPEADPMKGRRGGKGKREPKRSPSSSLEFPSTTTTA